MKRLLVFILALVLLASIALASTVKVTLDAAHSVETQSAAFLKYLAALPDEQRAAWFEQIDIIASDRRTVFSLMAQDEDADVVFISSGGARYHESNMCRGLKFTEMLSAITKDAAIEMQRTPCAFCYPEGDNQ